MSQSDPIISRHTEQSSSATSRNRLAGGQQPLDPRNSPPGVVQQNDRWNRGAWLFRDSTLQSIEILLDEAFRVPGTNFRFGIDGIIGLVPGFGDVLAGLLSLIIPIAAWIRGVPYITLLRMATNIGIGVLVGSIPLFGDLFDIVWKANRRNYRLLTRHLGEPRRHTGRDWAFLGLLAGGIALVFAIPIVLIIWLFAWLLSR
jgi:hypothetical protein